MGKRIAPDMAFDEGLLSFFLLCGVGAQKQSHGNLIGILKTTKYDGVVTVTLLSQAYTSFLRLNPVSARFSGCRLGLMARETGRSGVSRGFSIAAT